MAVSKLKALRSFVSQPFSVYSLLSVAVIAPLLSRGYILTLDMVFTPVLRVPDYVSSSYLFYVLLHVLNFVVAADVIQKLMLFLILFLSGLGMHWLVVYIRVAAKRQMGEAWGAYMSGALYMINPFTYDRFMAGQFAVLLGYALLPWFVRALLVFLQQPARRSAMTLAGWAIVISIVSIHSIGLMAIIMLVALAAYAKRYWHDQAHLRGLLRYGLVAVAIFIIASSYWLLPLARGTGATAATVAGFGAGDQQAFATTGSTTLAKFSNVMQLQGFWLEQQGQYILPQNAVKAWGLLVIAIWVLVITGAIRLQRNGQRQVVVLFGILIVLGWILSAGLLSSWLARSVPLFNGYREPQKFIALVALGYAYFAGQGLTVILERYGRQSKIKSGIVIGMAALLLVGFTRPMFWGFDGQLKPRHYPADWFTVNQRLDRDTSHFKVLFLPWHLYMSYDFSGRIIAAPAVKFFDKPMLVNQDPEFKAASPSKPTAQQFLLNNRIVPEAAGRNDLGSQLNALQVKYVLLAKELDYADYRYLDTQKDLQLVQESATLKLYRNEAFQGDK